MLLQVLGQNLKDVGPVDIRSMFTNCAQLSTVPLLDTSNGTDMSNMFTNCARLTTVPFFDTNICRSCKTNYKTGGYSFRYE